jgi:inner membrane protein
MANRAAHAAGGALASSGIWLAHCKRVGRKTGLAEVATVGAIGMFGGILADVLEPAHHPHHRGFLHSWTLAGLLAYGVWKISKSPDWSEELKVFLQMLSAAYGSHLLLDCGTPLGLPPA